MTIVTCATPRPASELLEPTETLNSLVELSEGALMAKKESVLTKLSMALMPSCVTFVALPRKPPTDAVRVPSPMTATPA
ncbi:MAG: hypothetical protein JMDDDDMK_05268 [Acidobacteria bacterium]|nr:hypothetical protein [Acidobacteriota bacterium]